MSPLSHSFMYKPTIAPTTFHGIKYLGNNNVVLATCGWCSLHFCQDSSSVVYLLSQINELQSDLNKLQSQQISLQMEHKELKKKQRRSERYYTNKQTKDSGSQGNSVQEEDVDMVGDVSLQGDLSADDPSEEGI